MTAAGGEQKKYIFEERLIAENSTSIRLFSDIASSSPSHPNRLPSTDWPHFRFYYCTYFAYAAYTVYNIHQLCTSASNIPAQLHPATSYHFHPHLIICHCEEVVLLAGRGGYLQPDGPNVSARAIRYLVNESTEGKNRHVWKTLITLNCSSSLAPHSSQKCL